jgi:hypothetical protein
MSDLNFQNFSTVQNSLQPKPNTIASTTTIAPSTLITFISGTVAVGTVTPPVTGQHMLVLIYTNAAPETIVTTGNILNAITPTQNVPTLLFYDPAQAKYYGCAGNLT